MEDLVHGNGKLVLLYICYHIIISHHCLLRCFIIWGVLSAICGVIVFFLLPDTLDSRYLALSNVEKDMARQVLDDAQRPTTQSIQWHHIRESLRESRFYCQIIISILVSLPNSCIGNFSSQIIHEMGFSVC